MFLGRPSVLLSVRPSMHASVRASVRDSRGSFMFPRYLQYLLMDFRQSFVTGASRFYSFLGISFKSIFINFFCPKQPSTRARTVILLTMPLLYGQFLCGFTSTNRAAVNSKYKSVHNSAILQQI